MKIGTSQLLPENIAPSNAKSISIYNGNTKVCDVDISKMQPQNLGKKLYSFGLLSDIHLSATTDTENSANGARFDSALTYFENQGCAFACISGDITNVGFYTKQNDEILPRTTQFAEYKRIVETHDIPVYGCCGNHDSYYIAITENLADLETYTGDGLYFIKTQGDDVFIFVGQDTATTPMSVDAFEWLKVTLETYKNNRCFLFIHPFVSDDDSGNPLGIYENKTFDYNNSAWGNARTAEFKKVLASYPNVIVFHGHSHMLFESQEKVCNANYSTTLGFKSVHIPSTVYCRDIRSGNITNADMSQGYICDVYNNHIVLKGYNFTASSYVPIAQYCVET